MKSYDFILKFSLSNKSIQPREYTDKLFEAGCDDALVGFGKNLINIDKSPDVMSRVGFNFGYKF